MMGGLAVLCLLLLQTGCHGFGIFEGPSLSHQDITASAIFEVTLDVCRAEAGKDFTLPTRPYTADSVATACRANKSIKSFVQVVETIQDENKRIDIRYFYDSKFHFDREQFAEAKVLITDGLRAVKECIKRQYFEVGRKKLGTLLHTAQDFYSHSNWVENGETSPNANLFKSGSIGNLAAEDRATCRSCVGDNCTNNILEDIKREKILTTGYFGLHNSSKPSGKCSHGGGLDATSEMEPTGGINKDKSDSEHGHLHSDAAKLAIAATKQILEDIRGVAGNKRFLQFMGINKGKALCFVIDTTESMGDDITEVRRVTREIIETRVGTEDEPPVYILVPFNDTGFGPLTRTTDPDEYKRAIDSLRPTGGGDAPEMSLSGLQLALTGAPPGSDIFLFTDAAAKDDNLTDVVLALIEQKKSVVNFMITGLHTEANETDDQQQQSTRMTKDSTQVYEDLARFSGGNVIQTTKSQLSEATSIITESSSSAQVLLLQETRNPGKADNFTFAVDGSVTKLTIYITGRSFSFTLIGPSGANQTNTDSTGPLINSSKLVGNFQTVRLNVEVGEWEIRMVSSKTYTLRVIGDSSIDFLFDFLEVSDGPLGGFVVLENRPRAGANTTVRVTITGSETAKVTEVSLVEPLTSKMVTGRVEPQGRGKFHARFDMVPSGEFVVVVKGQSGKSSSRKASTFHRQATTTIRASAVTLTADDSDNDLEPGTSLAVPFTVVNNGTGGTFTIKATNDQNYLVSFPNSLAVTAGGTANGTVNITAPAGARTGTTITMTIEATAPGGSDSNYVVRLLTVLTKVTDFTDPECRLLSLSANCSSDCNATSWDLSLQMKDEVNGSGIDAIRLSTGDGVMNTSFVSNSTGNVTLVTYNASCCSPDVEFTVADVAGNVGRCSFTVRAPTTTTATTTTTTTTAAPTTAAATKSVQSFLLCLGLTLLGFGLII